MVLIQHLHCIYLLFEFYFFIFPFFSFLEWSYQLMFTIFSHTIFLMLLQRDVTYEEAKQFAEENGLMFVEASAKT